MELEKQNNSSNQFCRVYTFRSNFESQTIRQTHIVHISQRVSSEVSKFWFGLKMPLPLPLPPREACVNTSVPLARKAARHPRSPASQCVFYLTETLHRQFPTKMAKVPAPSRLPLFHAVTSSIHSIAGPYLQQLRVAVHQRCVQLCSEFVFRAESLDVSRIRTCCVSRFLGCDSSFCRRSKRRTKQ